jgi:polyhydroxybutyrate depolymerase
MTHWMRRSIPRGYLITATVLLLACFLVSGCRSAEVAQPSKDQLSASESASCVAGDHLDEIDVGGQLRPYRMHIPSTIRKDKSAALVLGFHGNGGTADVFETYSGFSIAADREGFIAVYPQGAGQIPTWEVDAVANNQDVQFMRALIERVETQCAVDPSRIYATGHSRGGGMANRLACDLSDRIAAIGPVSGFYPPEGGCEPVRGVAIIAFHGNADPVVPYNGIGNQNIPPGAYFAFGIPITQWASAWAARNACGPVPASILNEDYLTGQAWSGCRNGADVILYTIPGGGHGWPGGSESITSEFNTAQMIWDFFEAHPSGKH